MMDHERMAHDVLNKIGAKKGPVDNSTPEHEGMDSSEDENHEFDGAGEAMHHAKMYHRAVMNGDHAGMLHHGAMLHKHFSKGG